MVDGVINSTRPWLTAAVVFFLREQEESSCMPAPQRKLRCARPVTTDLQQTTRAFSLRKATLKNKQYLKVIRKNSAHIEEKEQQALQLHRKWTIESAARPQCKQSRERVKKRSDVWTLQDNSSREQYSGRRVRRRPSSTCITVTINSEYFLQRHTRGYTTRHFVNSWKILLALCRFTLQAFRPAQCCIYIYVYIYISYFHIHLCIVMKTPQQW